MNRMALKHRSRLLSVLETKDDSGSQQSADSVELKAAMSTLLKTFEEFKAKNDQEIAELKKSMVPGRAPGADPVTVEEVKKLNDALAAQTKQIDELRLSLKRSPRQTTKSGVELTDLQVKHRDAFLDYVRRGVDAGLLDNEVKALSVGTNPDGGYLVPVEAELAMDRLLSEASPMRSVCTVRQVSTAIFKKPFNLGGAASGWVGEQSSRPVTDTPVLDELNFPVMELYAFPLATQSILDDSAVNIEQWLADEVNVTFAEQESDAFINGNGVNKPHGILQAPTVANASWTWGKLGFVVSGASGAFVAAPNGGDCLIDLVYSLKAGFRSGARFMMNRTTMSEVRKLKDTDGAYLWQPGITAGQPSTILGFPTIEAEEMPDTDPDAFAIAFGDFRRGYLIVDRIGVRVLRDAFTQKPYVGFYTTKRVGGGIQNYEAIKLLKFST
jgi:HK97 family phage major capsid protein